MCQVLTLMPQNESGGPGFILWLGKVSFVEKHGHRMKMEGLRFILWNGSVSFAGLCGHRMNNEGM